MGVEQTPAGVVGVSVGCPGIGGGLGGESPTI